MESAFNNNNIEIQEVTKFVNCTPHAIKYKNNNGEIITLEPSGNIARLDESEEELCSRNGALFVEKKFSDIIGLPAPEPGTMYIVSGLVQQHNKTHRNRVQDLLVPNTGETAVRNEKGFIDYVVSFMI